MWNFLSHLIWSIIMLRTDPQGLAKFLFEIKILQSFLWKRSDLRKTRLNFKIYIDDCVIKDCLKK